MKKALAKLPRLAVRYSRAAPTLGRSTITIKRRAASGQLPTIPLGERCRRISVPGLRRLMGQKALEPGIDRLLSGVEVAAVLDVSASTASRLIRSGVLPSVPWGSGARVPLGRLEVFIAERTEGGAA
jgi:hypothetical protein